MAYKYALLAEQLEKEIALTRYLPGQKIPTEDELAEQYSMSRNTVRQAVNLLVAEGYLIKIQGSGTYVPEQVKIHFNNKISNATENKCIGVILNQTNAYIFPRLLMGISDYLFEHGYSMIIRCTFNNIAKEEQALTELLSSNLAGLIIEPTRSGLPRVNHNLYQKIAETHPCVLVHADIPGFTFPMITPGDVEGYELLVDHLVANGHIHIAAICKFDEQTGVRRFMGYASGLKRNRIELDESRILWFADEDFDEMFSDANAHRVMKIIKGCTAVMCFNDDLASKFFLFLEKQNIRVPEDLSIVAFDNSLQGFVIPLTTIEHPKELLGRAAGKAMLTLLNNPKENVSICFPAELIEGKTVRKIN